MAEEKPTPPNTISDAKMKSLRERARKANPNQDSFTHPDAIKSRKLASAQYKKRHLN